MKITMPGVKLSNKDYEYFSSSPITRKYISLILKNQDIDENRYLTRLCEEAGGNFTSGHRILTGLLQKGILYEQTKIGRASIYQVAFPEDFLLQYFKHFYNSGRYKSPKPPKEEKQFIDQLLKGWKIITPTVRGRAKDGELKFYSSESPQKNKELTKLLTEWKHIEMLSAEGHAYAIKVLAGELYDNILFRKFFPRTIIESLKRIKVGPDFQDLISEFGMVKLLDVYSHFFFDIVFDHLSLADIHAEEVKRFRENGEVSLLAGGGFVFSQLPEGRKKFMWYSFLLYEVLSSALVSLFALRSDMNTIMGQYMAVKLGKHSLFSEENKTYLEKLEKLNQKLRAGKLS